MNTLAKTAIILMLTFVESLFVFLPATLLFLTSLNYYHSRPSNFVLAFLAGVGIDILQVRPVGKTSIALVVILFISYLYADRMREKTVLFLGVTIFIALFFYAIFTYFL